MQNNELYDFSQMLDNPVIQKMLSSLIKMTEESVEKSMESNEVYYPLTPSHLTLEEVSELKDSGIDIERTSPEGLELPAFLRDYALKMVESKPEYSEYLQWSSLQREKYKLEFEINGVKNDIQKYSQLTEKLETLSSQLTQVNEALEKCTYSQTLDKKAQEHVR